MSTNEMENRLGRVLDHDGVQAVALRTPEGHAVVRTRAMTAEGVRPLMSALLHLADQHRLAVERRPPAGGQGRVQLRLATGQLAFQVEEGPHGLAMVAFESGHPVVKSLRRMMRRLAGSPRSAREARTSGSHQTPHTASEPREAARGGA